MSRPWTTFGHVLNMSRTRSPDITTGLQVTASLSRQLPIHDCERKGPVQVESVTVRYVRLSDRTGHGTDAPPMALVLIDGSSVIKDVNVSMGKGLLGLSEEMLPTSRDARSVPLTPLFFEVNRQIIETRDLCRRPTRGHRGTTSLVVANTCNRCTSHS